MGIIDIAAATGLYRVLTEDAPAASSDVVEWASYSRDPGGSRYSPLDQIHRGNVKHLEVAWTYRTGDWSDGRNDTPKTGFKATPIVVAGTLSVSTIYGRVIALDPETGSEHWTFDPKLDRSVHRSEIGNRGVATWIDTAQDGAEPPRRHIFVATIDAPPGVADSNHSTQSIDPRGAWSKGNLASVIGRLPEWRNAKRKMTHSIAVTSRQRFAWQHG